MSLYVKPKDKDYISEKVKELMACIHYPDMLDFALSQIILRFMQYEYHGEPRDIIGMLETLKLDLHQLVISGKIEINNKGPISFMGEGLRT